MHSRAAAICLALSIALTGCQQRQEAPHAAKARRILEFVVQKVRDVQPDAVNGFGPETESALAEARRAVDRSRSDEDTFHILNRFLVSLNDGHVELRLREDSIRNRDCADLPVSWRPDGLIFTRDVQGIERGARLAELNGLDATAVLQRFRSMVPAENEGRLKYVAARRLGLGIYLRELGVVDAAGTVPVATESTDGTRTEFRIPLRACSAQVDDPWVGFDVHEDASLAVFWFKRFEFNQEMAAAMERFFEAVDQKGIGNVAVDLRGNEGGDSTVAFAFLQHFADIEYRSFAVDVRVSDELTRATPAFGTEAMSAVFVAAGLPPIPAGAGHYLLPADLVKYGVLAQLGSGASGDMTRVSNRGIYMITDAGTFSSGNLFAIMLRDNGIGTLVGEPTGNKVNFNGSELRFPIPDTDFYLNLSSSRMIRPDPSRGDAPAIEPDVRILTTQADIATGRDPQLEYLLARSRQK